MSQQMTVDTIKKVQGAIPSGREILRRTCSRCRRKDEDTKRGILRRTALREFQETSRANDPRDAETREFAKSRFGYDFSRVPARAVPAASDAVLNRAEMTNDAGFSFQESPDVPGAGFVRESPFLYSPEGVRVTKAGSGGCQNGGGESVCNLDNGNYDIVSNSNTCCTKSCTQEHEQTHVTDITGWGCCKALSDALKMPGAKRNELVTKYNTWMQTAVPITECNAYSHDVICADKMATDKDCSGKGKNTDCCKDILDYKARYGATAKTVCASAPKKVAPCPF
jgi:hypothetical protein